MAATAPHMQRAFTALSRELALSMGALRTASGNIQYAANLIAYSRRKKH